MKKNQGVTLITLIITIIVMILVASTTIYTGLNTLNSAKRKSATDTLNVIYQALNNNEDIIPSDKFPGKMISECDSTEGEELSNDDFKLLNLDYTADKYKIVFSRNLIGEDKITYTFSYKDDMGNSYDDISYSFYKDYNKVTIKPEFDTIKKVNRPVIVSEEMTPIGYSGEVKDIYKESWYNYEKGISKLATMKLRNGETYVWIPRFAYRIQNFYLGKSYEETPYTAIDIVFLRDDTSYMPNGEILNINYSVHPAFDGGKTGFWIMTKPYSESVSSITNAVSKASNGTSTHLMKNSEYAATLFLIRYLQNNEVVFNQKEFVAAGCNISDDNFDNYSSNSEDINYIENIKGQALTDTPWNFPKGIVPTIPASGQYLLRDVSRGGDFYYEATSGSVSALCRSVISK